jgi:hypothetical protein
MPNMVSRPSKTHSSPADEAGAFVCLFRCRQERQAMRAGTQQFTNLELFHDTSLLPKEKTEVFSRRRRLRKGVRVAEEENNPRAPHHSKAVGNEASAVLCKNEQRFPFTKTPRPIHLPQANNGEEIMDQKASMIGGGVERSCGGPPRLLLHHRRSSRSPESLQPHPQSQAHTP